MRFDNIIIEDKVKEKILSKHNVTANEVVNVLLSKPLVLKTKLERYIAIGHFHRYLTIIFDKKEKSTNIVTAYQSSEAQIKLYKRKNG
jgi:uncharacterized DUF497 family protein